MAVEENAVNDIQRGSFILADENLHKQSFDQPK